MMTILVATILVLALSLFALMAIVPLMLETKIGGDLPNNVVALDYMRCREHKSERPAA